MHNNIERKLKDILSAVLEVSVDLINETSSSDTIDSWDSLRQMNLIVALEEEFKIQFSDDEILEMDNFSLIRSVLIKKYEKV